MDEVEALGSCANCDQPVYKVRALEACVHGASHSIWCRSVGGPDGAQAVLRASSRAAEQPVGAGDRVDQFGRRGRVRVWRGCRRFGSS